VHRYIWDKLGLPYGLFSMQGAEQKNGQYRTDLSQHGCTNHWMSETELPKNKFFQRTIREYRQTFFSTQRLAQPYWCRSKFAGECSLCEQFGHRRPTCPLRRRTFDAVFINRPQIEHQDWVRPLPGSSPPLLRRAVSTMGALSCDLDTGTADASGLPCGDALRLSLQESALPESAVQPGETMDVETVVDATTCDPVVALPKDRKKRRF
jgi:hypothetical protein